MNDYFLICCSTKEKNKMSCLLESNYSKQNNINYNFEKENLRCKFKIDFTHALINNCTNEYFLKEKNNLPLFNEINNSFCLSHTYYTIDKKELNGFQNLSSSVDLMIKCLDCAEKQNINIKHCHCLNFITKCNLLNDCLSNEPVKLRLLSLKIKKDHNNVYDRDTTFLYCEYDLQKKEIGNLNNILYV